MNVNLNYLFDSIFYNRYMLGISNSVLASTQRGRA
jgi:hypothetical protein